MNYRHAFHAGNFADVMKHALLVRMLVHFARKETPFRVIDTHAGIGLYDLAASEAARTGEWHAGIGRLDEPFAPEVEALLTPYREILRKVRERHGPTIYPGSPAIIREMLRANDRAIVIEKHPDDAALLDQRFNAAGTVKVLHLDGWTALPGLIPPKERRGLVFVDPPYEEPGELLRAADRLARAHRKWPTGCYALWYPIKDPAEIEGFMRALGDRVDAECLRLELAVDRVRTQPALIGSGLVVVNPPWTLADEAALILPALARRLARDETGGVRIEPVARYEKGRGSNSAASNV